MNKEIFRIPMPDEQTIQIQTQLIVAAASKQKVSFISYLKSMYQQIGIKHLFSDRSELIFAWITAIILSGLFLVKPEPSQANVNELYGFIFLISPVLFLTLSIYTYSNKIISGTFELEMTCKYNVYQIIAFRMLIFSVIAIMFNTMTLVFMSMFYEDVHFARAFMISSTGLFAFSILILFALMKRRSTVAAAATIIGWTLGNLLLIYMDNPIYRDVLVNMPLFVYALVFIGTLYGYLKSLNRFIHFQYAEGDY